MNATFESSSPRLRRTAGIRVRRNLPVATTNTTTSSGGNSKITSTTGVISSATGETANAFKLTPSLEVTFPEIFNGKGSSREEGFRLWKSDAEDERRRVLVAFQQKFGGARLQPCLQAVAERLRNQLNKLSAEERKEVLAIVRSPDLFKTACCLLKWELTNKSLSLFPLEEGDNSFAEVFRQVSEAENLHSLAIEYITSAARTTPHSIVLSSSIVVRFVFFFIFISR